ncbi:MAG: histidine kinase [Sulfurimonas sp. RIFOXYD12_FULL_33_39]|uniref:ABC transporter substrate-binding protein n=1 Tax=unclassified Sulfurimonas TaxID=2623549 RepID=UPI0008C7A925|nr:MULTISPECIES: ABC transporter substrate-binding protein [unclassified Sulfurimonas]OHE04445.1 MAG: histidine kinase [Sulfurimonas sp. RIFCSPLOWO2_12_FULL_34_6]OHE10863.1 MAG: histidine kinase [Sulfurimonas sp. RIFOXYD12_FULL_33_39]OHE13367.1 MAG: histidine kinase [Sulfurimonas sp. RIFOXYD2_FULL_34_21]DAB27797.1 MAG TPA: histidine kinase [Sulfurimonas sp. UBA10385]
MKYLFIILSLFISLSASQNQPIQKVSLQLQWLDQFQFAGYYIAKEKGFYKEEGFDVDIKKFKYETDVVSDVLRGKTTYGIGRSSLIWYYAKGKDICLLSAIFQSSPITLIALQSSGIKDVKDFAGKKVMITQDAVEAVSVYAMINSTNTDKKSIEFKSHTFNIEDLISKNIDLYTGYISNEPYLLNKKGVEFKLFSPKDRGFDFYGDILFTSQEEATKYPQRSDAFKRASLRGWEYAFDNIEETVDIIYKKYNSSKKSRDALMFEALELKKLSYVNNIPLGSIEKNKVERILDIYRVMGLVESDVNLDRAIFSIKERLLSDEEERYLRQKGEIHVCVAPSSLPISAIEEGKFIGIGSNILNLAKESVKIPYKLVYTKTWEESLQAVIDKKCDLLPIANNSQKENGVKYTTPYHYEPLVIVTNTQEHYILDIENILDKELAVIEKNAFTLDLKRRYPNIKLNYVESLKDGFKGVEEGKYYGYIDNLITTAYVFKNIQNKNLKISGQFDDKVGISFGVSDDNYMLFEIFEKLSKSIKHSDINNFFSEWASINYVKNVNFGYLKEVIIFIIFIFFIVFYKQNLLNRKNIELERLKDELLELNKTLESKVSSAVSEMQKKDTYLLHKSRLVQMGEIVSMIAHQWKQPLSAISALHISMVMAIELEEYDLCNKKQRDDFLEFLNEKLNKIALNTQNLSSIVSDFSNFHKPNKLKEETSLNSPISQAYGLLEDSLSSENIDLCLELGSKNRVMLYKNEYIQVVLNIINNAKEQFRQYSVKDAQIVIKSYDRGDVAVMEISDNAGGIAEDIIDKIFDPYFSTKLDKNGTGLGLNMSKNIIEQHRNGKIYAQNIKDGAKFIIEICVHKEENE